MNRLNRCFSLLLLLVLFAGSSLADHAAACPFCDPVVQTLSEEIQTMEAVVLVRLVELPKFSDDDEELAKAKFQITKIIKGKELIGKTKTIETIYFGEPKPKQQFLVMGVDPPKLMWSTPLAVTDGAIAYMSKLPTLPEAGPKRLTFFQDYLEHADELLARDAYDEFAKASYKTILAVKEQMKHDKLVSWVQNGDIPASRRRLYLTLLGVCGGDKDLPLLEKMLRSTDRRYKAGLDALVGCYLTLRGEKGLPLIEDLFLKNPESEYADTYAAIMALRFHGNETDIIPRKRILQSLHHMLDRPQLADLVIPDLARWKDWSQVDRLVKLFKEADDKSSWVRVPVINYLRRCPLPAAKQQIAQLEKIDPAAVRRANTFFPFGAREGTANKDSAAKDSPAKDSAAKKSSEKGAEKKDKTKPKTEKTDASEGEQSPSQEQQQKISRMAAPPAQVLAEAAKQSGEPVAVARPLETIEAPAKPKANPIYVFGVSLLVGLGIFVLQWSVLRSEPSALR